ncbi:MAG: CarD family transcriptional regulator [Bdellovibrionota bacterium]
MKKKKKAPQMRSTSKTTFEIGDKAVYPAHGVGIIERIDNKEISGTILSFYVMRILDTDMTVMIPSYRQRRSSKSFPITKSARFSEIFESNGDQTQRHGTAAIASTWKKSSGSVYEIAQVMRDLYVLEKKTKTLSFGNAKCLIQPSLLVKELAIAKSTNEEEIEKRSTSCFSFPDPPPTV